MMTSAGTTLPYFFYSAGILFREGLEAMLVIIALAAGARLSNRSRDVYGGAALAVAASIVLAWAVNHVIGDNASDTLEGCFQVLAAATLFMVSSWLTAKSQADRWLKFISHKVESAEASAVPAFALGLTAFLAVMREGAETIVFFEALASGATEAAESHAIAAGIVLATVGLALTFVILTRAAHRLPLGWFFSVTSLLLYGLAVVFIGQGIASLQEAEVVSTTFVNHVPTITMLGVFPTVQSLTAQVILLLFAAVSIFLPRGRVRDSAPATARHATNRAV
jgi:high-affinity iron transporter